ncbi:MAG: pyridoxamine 5'-phosphate oxidase [Alphaproteobacteria bacterium]|nr:pyridoxamine 5'-phosphate oxidase [Alphaproteobacteria bacterium]
MSDSSNLNNQIDNPFQLFQEWYDLACQKEINDPNAMSLATVSDQGYPSLRIVLLKDFSDQGFVFYTNLHSRKAEEIKHNDKVALCFHWKSLVRSIRIEGQARNVSGDEADHYFATRPRESQIGAWASHQSHSMFDYSDLIKKVESFKEKFGDGLIPRPEFWSGYRIIPHRIEFWQNQPFRLHKRVVFIKEENQWSHHYLYP